MNIHLQTRIDVLSVVLNHLEAMLRLLGLLLHAPLNVRQIFSQLMGSRQIQTHIFEGSAGSRGDFLNRGSLVFVSTKYTS